MEFPQVRSLSNRILDLLVSPSFHSAISLLQSLSHSFQTPSVYQKPKQHLPTSLCPYNERRIKARSPLQHGLTTKLGLGDCLHLCTFHYHQQSTSWTQLTTYAHALRRTHLQPTTTTAISKCASIPTLIPRAVGNRRSTMETLGVRRRPAAHSCTKFWATGRV